MNKRSVRFCFLFGFLFLANSLLAQDTLVKKNGEKLIVEMMQISGDTLLFRFDSMPTKMSNADLLKVCYANGNTTTFETKIVKKIVPKPFLLPQYKNLPIEMRNELYYQRNFELSKFDVDKIIGSQNNRQIQTDYLSLKKSQNIKVFCASIVVLSCVGTLLYYALENSSGITEAKKLSNTYLLGLGATVAVMAAFSSTAYTTEKQKRKQLIYLYNSTYYSN